MRLEGEDEKTAVTSAARRKKRKRRCRSADGEENANDGGGGKGGCKLCAQDGGAKSLGGLIEKTCATRARVYLHAYTYNLFLLSFLSSKAYRGTVSVYYVRMTSSMSTRVMETRRPPLSRARGRGVVIAAITQVRMQNRNATGVRGQHCGTTRFAFTNDSFRCNDVIARCRNHAAARV